jgi:hypothetical protein
MPAELGKTPACRSAYNLPMTRVYPLVTPACNLSVTPLCKGSASAEPSRANKVADFLPRGDLFYSFARL